MLVFRSEIHKVFVRITNREDPDQAASQKQSYLDLHCLSRPFQQTTTVQNFTPLFFFCSQNVGFQV